MYEEIINLSTYYYKKSEIDSFLNGKANTSHSHSIGDITNLQSTLNGKANASHSHSIDNITNLQSTLNGKAASSHSHYASSISGLATVATSGDYNDLINKPSLDGGGGSGANVTVINSLNSDSTTDALSAYQGKVLNTALSGKVSSSSLASVATSGNYNDLSNKPNLASVATSGDYNDLSNRPTIPPGSIVDDALSSTSINPVQNKVINAAIQSLTNSGVVVDINLSTTSTNPVQNKTITNALNNKANTSNLSTVATSGNYNDLSNKPNLASVATSGSYNDLNSKPTIPTNTSQLTNDSGYVTTSDSRLSDARTPKAHTHAISEITNLQSSLDGKSNSGHDHGWTTELSSSPHFVKRNDGARLMEAYGYFSATVTDTGIGNAQYPTILLTCSHPPPISIFQGSRPGITIEIHPVSNGFEIRYYSTTSGTVYLYYHFMWSY